MMIAILVIALAALVNRFRGGGVIPHDPPGHRRLWSTPLMAGVAALVLDWPAALVFAACWFWWAVLPWGRWYTLGRGERSWSGQPDWFERAIESFPIPQPDFEAIPRGSWLRILDDHLCLHLRNVVALYPLALLLSWQASLVVLIGMSLAYEIAWRLIPEERGPTGWAEWATGALWGVALLVSAWS